ncbi:MAG: lipocalin-like domain-containing protein [Sphingobium sp.]
MPTIRERLVGAWGLVSFEGTMADGRIVSPMGRGAQGHIVYSDNGFVSVNLSRADRILTGGETRFDARGDCDIAGVARGYMAYSGAFEVDETRAIARHHFDLCLDPALIGTLQERHVRFFDDKLELSVRQAPGVSIPSALVWKRL